MNDKLSAFESSKASKKFVSETHLGGELTGWVVHEHKRLTKSNSHIDRYWFSPKTRKKLRSKVEVERFMSYLKEYGSDHEEEAWQMKAHLKNVSALVRNKRDSTVVTEEVPSNATKRKKTRLSRDVGKGTKKKTTASSSKSRKASNGDDEYSYGGELQPQSTSSYPRRNLRKRKRSQTIQESKQVVSPPKKRQNIIFAEAALAAFREYQVRMATEKPDPTSAFDLDTIAQPKERCSNIVSKGCKGIKSSKRVNAMPPRRGKKRNISESKAVTLEVNCINKEKGVRGQPSPSTTMSGVSYNVPEVAESKDSDESLLELTV
mmetsp:Transcript_24054/g.35799  ORF Transcript_24054/g.35799 Transcript_24054/m.35799 type:complete len:319 (+) Transcript_24054:165-1121(+)|eukprot:CAMPEP_0203671150 /NCGR_PEP_ID=MMETSP0090-20130426/7022_1 /ASSEMBLY_ACC=CAM_ASM_001088 /TAXON_ID=426623 /ORGANISM="Chaetoceros affinis, Strain CCMP159" /LENGTH=318 /DNA_ID=CAMNT_0050536161 /DNA_START=120 /DNA_END=1076 /DNA_ORIENTATION=-